MKGMRFLVACSALAACLVGALKAFGQEGTGEKIGEKVDRAVGQIREEARQLAEDVREGVEQMRVRVERMGVAARVYARIHWDKALTGATVSINVEKDGVANLTGTVATPQAKAKAETLALDTVGVERVVNNLQVVPPAAPEK
jgi:hyperosmotically inducible periplasmic protein